MIIGHVNLAAGFRGGERQTELLIRELSKCGYQQIAVVRKESELGDRLADVTELEIRRIGKPYIFGVGAAQGCDLLHAHEAKASQFTYWVKRLLGIPYVITRRVPRVPGRNPLTRAVYQNASAVVALSRAIKASLSQHNPSLTVQIIPSMSAELPVDTHRVAELQQRFAGKFVVGHIGALVNYHKGQQYLMEAARDLADSHPKMHFILLGRGKDEAWFRELAEGLSNVTFEGFVDNVGDYLALFDLFVFPSLQEGLGSILIDAMAARLPVIATEVGGIPDIVRDGVNGILVPPAERGLLAEAIQTLWQNEKLRCKIARQAEIDSRLYTPKKVANRYIQDVYHGKG